jgi:nitrite reductase (NADH) small subunit
MSTHVRWAYVCPIEAIVPNTGVCAKVGKQQAAVFRIVAPDGTEDGVYAIGNFDPKAAANVLARGLVGDVGGELVVASPVYKQHYALKNGRCLEDESLSVPSFAVRVFDGMVLVKETRDTQ